MEIEQEKDCDCEFKGSSDWNTFEGYVTSIEMRVGKKPPVWKEAWWTVKWFFLDLFNKEKNDD